MIEILGYIFAAILTVIAAFILYHIIRGAILGASLMRWQLIGCDWKLIHATKGWPLKLVRMFLNCWVECIGYDGSTTYTRNGRTWSGFGTGH
jgi:hypothetical protein